MIRSALDIVSAWASVLATTKSTPCSPLAIMLLTALPPAPPVPKTVIRGLSSRTSGIFRLMLMFASRKRRHRRRVGPVRRRPIADVDRVIRSSREAIVRPVRYSRPLLPSAAFAAVRNARDAPPADRPAAPSRRQMQAPLLPPAARQCRAVARSAPGDAELARRARPRR